MSATTTVGAGRPAAERGTPARKKGSRFGGVHGSKATPYLFLLPYLVLFVTFVVIPAVFGIWISLHNWDFLLPGKPFVGLENYAALFDPSSVQFEPFWNGMRATAIFTVASVPFLIVVPLGLAVLLNRRFPGGRSSAPTFFAPYVLGIAVIGLMWRYFLDPSFGVVNGLPQPRRAAVGRRGSPRQPWAWVSLVGVTIWWTLGFNAIIYLAGLGDISAEQYEAAELDGASQVAAVLECDGARPATGDGLRDHHHHPGQRQHVRPELPDHPGRPR